MTKVQFETENCVVLPAEEIERQKCLKQEYLNRILYKMAEDK